MSFDPISEVPEQSADRSKKSSPTRKDLQDALTALKPSEPTPPTAAEKERTKRLGVLEKAVTTMSDGFLALGLLDTRDMAAAERAIKALAVISKSGAVAITSIPDTKLGLDAEPKAARASRKSREDVVDEAPEKITAQTEADLPGYGPADDEGEEPEQNPEPDVEEETPEQVDERIKAGRQSRFSGRSNADTSADPRGAEDPNANDGF